MQRAIEHHFTGLLQMNALRDILEVTHTSASLSQDNIVSVGADYKWVCLMLQAD